MNMRAVSVRGVLVGVLFTGIVSLFAGCSTPKEALDPTLKWTPQRLFQEGRGELDDKNFKKATEYFDKLEARYPYGQYAMQAQLYTAYANYKDDEPALAVAACDRFIKLHPTHPNVDYAYYLKGLATFNEDRSFLARFSNQDRAERDPQAAADSFESFKILVTRFPESRYTADALGRMRYLVNALATHEVRVAQHYISKQAYVAAANRSKYVLEHYSNAPAVEEALVVMIGAYDKLEMPQLRDDARRVLDKNFPNSKYTVERPQDKKPWWQLW